MLEYVKDNWRWMVPTALAVWYWLRAAMLKARCRGYQLTHARLTCDYTDTVMLAEQYGSGLARLVSNMPDGTTSSAVGAAVEKYTEGFDRIIRAVEPAKEPEPEDLAMLQEYNAGLISLCNETNAGDRAAIITAYALKAKVFLDEEELGSPTLEPAKPEPRRSFVVWSDEPGDRTEGHKGLTQVFQERYGIPLEHWRRVLCYKFNGGDHDRYLGFIQGTELLRVEVVITCDGNEIREYK